MCGVQDVAIEEDECRARGGAVCRYRIHWRNGQPAPA